MMILGPLVAPSTSTVTPAFSSPVAVTLSPSTVITTGRVSVSPTATSVLSISMTSPTATFCCLLPARTIAYTAVSFVGPTDVQALKAPPVRERGTGSGAGARAGQRAHGSEDEQAPRIHGTAWASGLAKRGAAEISGPRRPCRQPGGPTGASHPWAGRPSAGRHHPRGSSPCTA